MVTINIPRVFIYWFSFLNTHQGYLFRDTAPLRTFNFEGGAIQKVQDKPQNAIIVINCHDNVHCQIWFHCH